MNSLSEASLEMMKCIFVGLIVFFLITYVTADSEFSIDDDDDGEDIEISETELHRFKKAASPIRTVRTVRIIRTRTYHRSYDQKLVGSPTVCVFTIIAALFTIIAASYYSIAR